MWFFVIDFGSSDWLLSLSVAEGKEGLAELLMLWDIDDKVIVVLAMFDEEIIENNTESQLGRTVIFDPTLKQSEYIFDHIFSIS